MTIEAACRPKIHTGEEDMMTRMTAEVQRWGSRNWAVYLGDQLIAVCVYLKGARRVAELLNGLQASDADGVAS